MELNLNQPVPSRKIQTSAPRFLDESKAELEPYYFTEKQIKFMDTYSRTMDIKAACEASGLSMQKVKENDYLTSEIKKIEQCFLMQHRVSMARGNHSRLMQKFENEYDKTGQAKVKAQFAGVLAKMAETQMKANGDLSDDVATDAMPNVQIAINFGGHDVPEDLQHIIDVGASKE